MLKQLLLWGAVCMGGLLVAQEPATIECRVATDIRMNKENQVTLYRVEKGEMVEKAVGSYTGEGYFGFRFIPEYEGFYVVGEKRNYYYPVWVEAGGSISIRLDKDGARLEGKRNSNENQALYQWLALAQPICNLSTRSFLGGQLSFGEFFRQLEEFIVSADRFKAGISTKNPRFHAMMSRYVDFQKDFYALNYLNTPKPQGYIWPKLADYSPYFATILSGDKFRDEVVLTVPEGFRLLRHYVAFASQMAGEPQPEDKLAVIASPILKGELTLDNLRWVKSAFLFREELEARRPLLSDEQLKRAEEMLKVVEEKNARQKAVDFTFPDATGKMISLSDFKGKVVLLDIWATWCGPCRAELPALLKLEKEMNGTDVVVIGVSVDKQKDYDKWKKMVDDGEVKGVQLFADGFGQFGKDYGVDGIPRFIVFNREGQIAEANAPRPSSPGLKELLNTLLKK